MKPLPQGAGARRRGLAVLIVASLLGPIGALLAVWLPEILHYHVTTPEIGKDVVAELRGHPEDALLARIDDVRFDAPAPETSRTAADEILAGGYHTREGEIVPVSLQTTAAGLRVGSPSVQLQISSLIVPETLLGAYRETGDERYFAAALQSAVSWARFERRTWVPVGFLWNDHAIAARVLVLTRLWREYRMRADFDPDLGAEILAFVARSTAFLARPSHYTARTNHGIMQDLALLHAALAFPGLPESQEHTRVALDRLALHLPFYVTAGGVVLEHSVGYQDFGVRVLRIALDYISLLQVTAPSGLRERYAAAECLQRHLTRADGSLPLYGDTRSATRSARLIAENAAVSCDGQPETRVEDEFGLASLRNFGDSGTQLFMAWTNFPGRSHKHDDELATWLWINGQDWWTASGYWPLGDADRNVAVSWRGTNAPHAVGEATATGSDSRLLYSLREGPVQLLDVERRAPDGRAYRRQVIGLDGAGFLVVDSASGDRATVRFETVWTLMPGIVARPLRATPAAFELVDPRSTRRLHVILASGSQDVQQLNGSRHPFVGMVALDGIIQTSGALVTTAPFGTWSAALWRPAGGTAPGSLVMSRWRGPEQWSLSMSAQDGTHTLTRNGAELEFTSPLEARRTWPLMAGAVARPAYEEAAGLYGEAAARYPPFRDYVEYRVRASAAIGGLFLAQYLLLWLLGRVHVRRSINVTFLALAWAATGSWLYYSYLA